MSHSHSDRAERLQVERKKAIDLVNLKESAQIDADYVNKLVDLFYARVRDNPIIGPIFDEAIGDSWGPHLETMKSFWSSIATPTKSYRGQPLPKHMALEGLQPWHFNIWLALFEEALKDSAPNEKTVTFFMESASRIARSLSMSIFPEERPLAS